MLLMGFYGGSKREKNKYWITTIRDCCKIQEQKKDALVLILKLTISNSPKHSKNKVN